MDLKRIREVVELMEEKSLEELEIEDKELKLRLRLRPTGGGGLGSRPREAAASAGAAPAPPVDAPAPRPPASAPASGPGGGDDAVDAGLVSVKSPIVGTFYRAPDPNSPAFVNVGDRVRVGQVLCIIEAMKLMNEIESEVAGVIVKIEQENGQPVQFGAPLFAIRVD